MAFRAEIAGTGSPPGDRFRPAWPGRAATPGPDASAQGGGTVLIVEDDYLGALVSESALAAAGFDICGVAATAEQAIAMAGSVRPDLVLMDIRLAGVRDGVEAAGVILDRYGIPSLFATAQADARTRERGESVDPLGWVLKPFAPEELVAEVRAAMAIARARGGGG